MPSAAARSIAARTSSRSSGDACSSAGRRNVRPSTAASPSVRDRAVVERREPAADRVAHAVGQRHLLRRVVEAALGEQQGEDLAGEQRVALRAGVHRARQRGRGLLAAGQRDQASDVVARQPAEHEPAAGADDVRQRRLRLRRALEHALVHRHDDHHGEVAQHPRDEVERHERAVVDPLQVVDEDTTGASWLRARSSETSASKRVKRAITKPSPAGCAPAAAARPAAVRRAPASGAAARRRRRRGRRAASRRRRRRHSARTISTHGQYAGAPRPQPRVRTTVAPSPAACSASAAARRVLPTPGSPRMRCTPPRPARASSNASQSSCNSRTRPTSGPSPGAGPGACLVPRRSPEWSGNLAARRDRRPPGFGQARISQRNGDSGSGLYVHVVPVRIAARRWRPSSGSCSAIRRIAERIARVTLSRARSAGAPFAPAPCELGRERLELLAHPRDPLGVVEGARLGELLPQLRDARAPLGHVDRARAVPSSGAASATAATAVRGVASSVARCCRPLTLCRRIVRPRSRAARRRPRE